MTKKNLSLSIWYLDLFPLFFYKLVDLQSNRSETASATDLPFFKAHNAKSERPPAAQVTLPSSEPDSLHRLHTEESSFRRVSHLLELGIVCLPGRSFMKKGKRKSLCKIYKHLKDLKYVFTAMWVKPLGSKSFPDQKCNVMTSDF